MSGGSRVGVIIRIGAKHEGEQVGAVPTGVRLGPDDALQCVLKHIAVGPEREEVCQMVRGNK